MYKQYYHFFSIKHLTLTLLALLAGTVVACAFDLSTYAESSALSEGKWVKISVSQTGMHLIPTADLRKMGFSDPTKVRIYGYGGARINDILSHENYIDDLPMVQSVATSRGIYFYAVGPVSWSQAVTGRYHHSLNPFSETGFYFVTQSDSPLRDIPSTGIRGGNNPATSFNEMIYHEKDVTSPGETGHLLVGEDFRFTPTQSFSFNMPGRIPDTKVWAEIAFVACSKSGSGSMSITANGASLPSTSSDIIRATTNESYYHGVQAISRKEFDTEGEKLSIGITYQSASLTSLAALNYISVNYTRKLALDNGKLQFTTDDHCLKLDGVSESTRIWDVTDPLDISSISPSVESGTATWSASYGNRRTYAAWDETATYPSPTIIGTVDNQNIHGTDLQPDMVIFTLSGWTTQAERLAQLHRNGSDSLNVIVLDQNMVFNEFSSGVPDVAAFRKCLKMFYDRGETSGHPLRYALFMGRATHDNRRLTQASKALRYPTMPTWQSNDGLSDNSSYTTDDIFAFLLDNSGSGFSSDRACIAIGRLPVTSLTEAKIVVDKIHAYVNSAPSGQWKNHVLLIADDADNGVHLDYSDQTQQLMENSKRGSDLMFTKVYIDAYDKVADVAEGARTDMFKALNDGVLWWNYIGHGNPTSLSHDKILTFSDINNLTLRKLPVMTALTCDFMRWDKNETSAGEIMMKNPNGGVIAMISATRPTGVFDNGNMARAIAPNIFDTDADNNIIPVGEALRRAKNSLSGNSNKLRYVFIGDPAMRLAIPNAKAVVTKINDIDIDGYTPPEIKASQNATVDGYITDASGSMLTGFNGIITSTLYDAEYSVITKGHPNKGKEDGKESIFEKIGSRLFVGSDSVKHGQFRINISMPAEISDNYRPAALQLYAKNSLNDDAVGMNRQFYVFGYDEASETDTVAPRINEFYLNHSSFKSGDKVNESPVAIARISDNRGINLSLAGIGHQMTMWLDGPSKTYNDVADYFTPSADDTASGTIAYPLGNLSDGAHSLRMRIWDTSGNAAEQSLDFFVENGMPAQIFDIYSDANPATVQANFYLSHNRPDAMVTVTMEIYDITGHLVWTSSQSGQSDLFTSFPITWDLRDMAGRRVHRGIYIYRATMLSDNGTQSNSVAKKIAVAAQ